MQIIVVNIGDGSGANNVHVQVRARGFRYLGTIVNGQTLLVGANFTKVTPDFPSRYANDSIPGGPVDAIPMNLFSGFLLCDTHTDWYFHAPDTGQPGVQFVFEVLQGNEYADAKTFSATPSVT
jgi:hypothetical protein